jgi:hypothetical protein
VQDQFHPDPNVQWIIPEDGQRNCPKHVEFRTRINLGISASVSSYCKEICYDARSHGRKILTYFIIHSQKFKHQSGHLKINTALFLSVNCAVLIDTHLL